MHLTGRIAALLIAAGSGITMALQGTLNSALGKVIGLLEATFVVHVVGLLFVSTLLFIFGLGKGDLGLFADSPWYTYLGGVLGVIIIYTVVRAIPPLGVAVATTAIILGQVFTAALVDHLGLFGMNKIPFTWHRVAGTILMAGGAWLLLKR